MVNTTITKTNTRTAVIDFRDGLQLAPPENYAMLHNGGSKRTGYPSVIKIALCDYSKGTGDNSVTVFVNIEPTLPFEWLEVCKAALGSSVVPTYEAQPRGRNNTVPAQLNGIGGLISAANSAAVNSGATISSIKGVLEYVADVVRGKVQPNTKESFTSIGGKIKEGVKGAGQQIAVPESITYKNGIDYQYMQDKVNIYQKKPDGFAPISRLSVAHHPYLNGQALSNNPWTFKITNGEAKTSESSTGTTTFNTQSMRNVTEAFIRISDRDMFRMMTMVTHFITIWENANCLQLLYNGKDLMEQERVAYSNSRH